MFSSRFRLKELPQKFHTISIIQTINMQYITVANHQTGARLTVMLIFSPKHNSREILLTTSQIQKRRKPGGLLLFYQNIFS